MSDLGLSPFRLCNPPRLGLISVSFMYELSPFVLCVMNNFVSVMEKKLKFSRECCFQICSIFFTVYVLPTRARYGKIYFRGSLKGFLWYTFIADLLELFSVLLSLSPTELEWS